MTGIDLAIAVGLGFVLFGGTKSSSSSGSTMSTGTTSTGTTSSGTTQSREAEILAGLKDLAVAGKEFYEALQGKKTG